MADEIEVVSTRKIDPVGSTIGSDPTYTDLDANPREEVVVQETIVAEERDPKILRSLLTGLPSPSSLITSLTTFAINILLAGMTFDYTYRATYFHPAHDLSFARLGYVSESTASILIREPDIKHLPIFASYRVSEDDRLESAWRSAGRQIDFLDGRSDFTGQFFIEGLRPDTKYQYVVSNNHTGHFITSPGKGRTSNRPGRAGSYTFVHSSCLKNNFPYNPFAHPLSNTGLRYLGETLKTLEAQFMIFLGDFIYIDVPKRHGFSDAEDYRREYRQIYASPDYPAAAKDTPWIHTYDDHEIANDWDKNTTGYFPAAVNAYELYHTSVNPPVARTGKTYFQWVDGPASFFMLDTRRYRSPNDRTNGSDPMTGEATKTMLGSQQLDDVLAWLRQPERTGVRWKIMISSVPFTKNWNAGDSAQDTWRGYLGERQVILEAMWDVGAKGGIGVIILSGDRHEFAATAFPPPPNGKEVSSALAPLGNAVNKVGAMLDSSTTAGKTLQTTRKRWPAQAVVHEYSASPLQMFYLPIRTYAESSSDPAYVSDVCIKYIPEGNSKFGAVTISSTSDQSVLHYRLFVDGKEKWSHTITTPSDTGNEFKNRGIWG